MQWDQAHSAKVTPSAEIIVADEQKLRTRDDFPFERTTLCRDQRFAHYLVYLKVAIFQRFQEQARKPRGKLTCDRPCQSDRIFSSTKESILPSTRSGGFGWQIATLTTKALFPNLHSTLAQSACTTHKALAPAEQLAQNTWAEACQSQKEYGQSALRFLSSLHRFTTLKLRVAGTKTRNMSLGGNSWGVALRFLSSG